MAESQQGHGRGSSRVGEQGATRHDQRGGRQGGQAPHVEPDHDAHGQSVAAWTAVGIIFVGALVMAIAVVIAAVWLFVVGAVIAVAGGISGKVLSAMGFGASGQPGH
jgi:hypothetical protein